MADDERVIRNLRNMAWERAKGELRSMLHTFWGEGTHDYEQFKEFKAEIERFIKYIEDNGLQE